MTNQVLKTVLIGGLIGTGIYFLPFFFVGKVFFIFLLIFFFFGFFRRRHLGTHSWAHTDKIRAMSEEEYNAYKEKAHRYCGDRDQSNNNSTEPTS